ncbi:hypothetical protein GZ78_15180 [Endozoicomonas numazuensis]|uniref:Uncharacterized protein n=1 Tax=Endozoicomonas numazuensis TaxID=1137799 RepID=A0A081NFG1_9GAMM|nr:hypothetical protein GZ78_15180 [Endozoicomonas numazuensis]
MIQQIIRWINTKKFHPTSLMSPPPKRQEPLFRILFKVSQPYRLVKTPFCLLSAQLFLTDIT